MIRAEATCARLDDSVLQRDGHSGAMPLNAYFYSGSVAEPTDFHDVYILCAAANGAVAVQLRRARGHGEHCKIHEAQAALLIDGTAIRTLLYSKHACCAALCCRHRCSRSLVEMWRAFG